MDEETRATIIFYFFLVEGVVLIGMTTYLAILHPIEVALGLLLTFGVLFTIWFLIEYVFTDVIAGLIARALIPYFAGIVLEAMPEDQQGGEP